MPATWAVRKVAAIGVVRWMVKVAMGRIVVSSFTFQVSSCLQPRGGDLRQPRAERRKPRSPGFASENVFRALKGRYKRAAFATTVLCRSVGACYCWIDRDPGRCPGLTW